MATERKLNKNGQPRKVRNDKGKARPQYKKKNSTTSTTSTILTGNKYAKYLTPEMIARAKNTTVNRTLAPITYTLPKRGGNVRRRSYSTGASNSIFISSGSGKFRQVKPKAVKAPKTTTRKPRALTGYNIFVKDNYHSYKKMNPQLQPKEILAYIGKIWTIKKKV